MSAVLSEPAADSRAPEGGGDAEFIVVLNEASGRNDKGEVRRAIETELSRAGRRFRFVPFNPPECVRTCHHAAALAQAQGGILVAAGGDGTLNAAAQAALTYHCPLGLIPQGTFNLFARDLGLPLEAAAATRVLLRARPEPVQVGLVNEHVFLANASVGLYPKLLADREAIKQKLGRRRWIAAVSGLVSLLEWRLQLVLDADLDGLVTRLRTPTLFVCNNRLQLERLGIEPEVVEDIGHGHMAGLMARSVGTGLKLRLMARAMLGKLGDTRELHAFNLRSLTVSTRSARRLKVAIDGEVLWMELPLRFAVSPRPLQVMLPPPGERLPRR